MQVLDKPNLSFFVLCGASAGLFERTLGATSGNVQSYGK